MTSAAPLGLQGARNRDARQVPGANGLSHHSPAGAGAQPGKAPETQAPLGNDSPPLRALSFSGLSPFRYVLLQALYGAVPLLFYSFCSLVASTHR